MKLTPLSDDSRTWPLLKEQWQKECADLKEDFSTFAIGTFGALNPLAMQSENKSGLYGLQEGERFVAFCQVNRLLMSRYTSPVLRARFATVSPNFDYGRTTLSEYSGALLKLFSGVIWLARNELPARHIHFHLRSPADATFFSGVSAQLDASPFSRFAIRGAWMECSLRND